MASTPVADAAAGEFALADIRAFWVRPLDEEKRKTFISMWTRAEGVFGEDGKEWAHFERKKSAAHKAYGHSIKERPLTASEFASGKAICDEFTQLIGKKLSSQSSRVLFRLVIRFPSTGFRRAPGPPSVVQRLLEALFDEHFPMWKAEGTAWNLFYHSDAAVAAYPPVTDAELALLQHETRHVKLGRQGNVGKNLMTPEGRAFAAEVQETLMATFELSNNEYRAKFVEDRERAPCTGRHPAVYLIALCLFFWSGHCDVQNLQNGFFPKDVTDRHFDIARMHLSGDYETRDLVRALRATNIQFGFDEWDQVRREPEEQEEEDLAESDLGLDLDLGVDGLVAESEVGGSLDGESDMLSAVEEDEDDDDEFVYLPRDVWRDYIDTAQTIMSAQLGHAKKMIFHEFRHEWLSKATMALAREKMKLTSEGAIVKTYWTKDEMDIIAYVFAGKNRLSRLFCTCRSPSDWC